MSTSKNHHWWPQCISRLWRAEDGCVGRMLSDGNVQRLAPKNLGVIGHGHTIKLGTNPGDATVWDYNFESEFQRADDCFPKVITWLEGLERDERFDAKTLTERFLPQKPNEDLLIDLMEGLVSLCVRSPMNRRASVILAERLSGQEMAVRKQEAITTLNMRHQQRMLADALGTRGKFVVIYSPNREFIFGDGLFHNLTSPAGAPVFPEILVPLTPNMSALFVRPFKYSTEPRLATLMVTGEEAGALNLTVQIYARDMIFYRSEQPPISKEFCQGKHLRYTDDRNPVARLIQTIPGL